MKILLAALTLLLQSAVPQITERISFEGVVVQDETGTPIPGATISVSRLLAPDQLSGLRLSTAEPAFEFETTADRSGHFVIQDLEKVPYGLFVSADGFVPRTVGICLASCPPTIYRMPKGQIIDTPLQKETRITLQRASNISGRIHDPNGRPLAGIMVRLLSPTYDGWGQRSFDEVGKTRSDDRGEYRFYWLAPGSYALLAGSATPSPAVTPSDIGSVNENPQQFVEPAFYPSAQASPEAQTFELRPAADRTGMDFTLVSGRFHTVHGHVVNETSTHVPELVNFQLLTKNPLSGSSSVYPEQTYDAKTGEFELRNVPFGSQLIVATVQDPQRRRIIIPALTVFVSDTRTNFFGGRTANLLSAVGDVALRIGDADIEDVVLVVKPGFSITGEIRIDGPAAATDLSKYQIQLLPATSGMTAIAYSPVSNPQVAGAAPSGKFLFENVFSGSYRISIVFVENGKVSNIRDDQYIKEIRYRGKDILGQAFSISDSGSQSLEIVLDTRAGALNGFVTDDLQYPIGRSIVVLVSNDHREQRSRYYSAVAGIDGKFQIRRIAPGDYKVFATTSINSNAFADPAVIARVENQGLPVHVGESSSQNVTVKVIRR